MPLAEGGADEQHGDHGARRRRERGDQRLGQLDAFLLGSPSMGCVRRLPR
jgi:hypothetical protein